MPRGLRLGTCRIVKEDMNLKQHLTEKKYAILKSWNDTVMLSAGWIADFSEKQDALLADGTGHGLERGIEGLFDALLKGVITDGVSRFLDNMIRIRAASDFKASQAVAFILEVKKIVRKELGSEILDDPHLQDELAAWDSAIDDLALFVFDIYVRSRESVLEIRADEEKKETLRLLKRAKLIPDDQE